MNEQIHHFLYLWNLTLISSMSTHLTSWWKAITTNHYLTKWQIQTYIWSTKRKEEHFLTDICILLAPTSCSEVWFVPNCNQTTTQSLITVFLTTNVRWGCCHTVTISEEGPMGWITAKGQLTYIWFRLEDLLGKNARERRWEEGGRNSWRWKRSVSQWFCYKLWKLLYI